MNSLSWSNSAIRNIYAALSKEDCLTIFNALHDGPLSSKELLTVCNTTARKYYLALSMLRRAKLIERRDGKYVHTYIGSYIYSSQAFTWKIIRHMDKLELYSRVNDILVGNPSEHALELSSLMLKNLEGYIGTAALEPAVIYDKWDDLVAGLLPIIESAKLEVLLANRALEPKIVPILLNSAKRGRKIKIINDTGLIKEKIKQASIDPQLLTLYKGLINTPGVGIKVFPIPYSFVIVDKLELGVEIVNPVKFNEFFIGYRFRSATLADKMALFFNDMWDKAQDYKATEAGVFFAATY
ncbi:MAG: hypothetical protein QW837_02850 [Conexivisphaerales archaeon]